MPRKTSRGSEGGTRSRLRRLRDMRMRRRTLLLSVTGIAGLFVIIGVYALASTVLVTGASATSSTAGAEVVLPTTTIASSDGSASASAEASKLATSGVDVEVPHLVGKSVQVAEAVLTGAGFAAQTRVADPPLTGVSPDTVLEQWPDAGALIEPGSAVVITYQPRTGVTASVSAPVVVIDAGHQKTPNTELEPIGPRSKILKPKAAMGGTGVATQVPEYQRNLEIAKRVREALVAKGAAVVMIRTRDDVDIANSERAKTGNKAKADLVIRIHCDTSTDTTKRGISTLYPGGNSWVKGIESRSLDAANRVQAALRNATGAPSLGVFSRGDMSGFNYSTRPVIMVLCGFLSNEAEDKKLGEPAYQAKVAAGIADGAIAYLEAR